MGINLAKSHFSGTILTEITPFYGHAIFGPAGNADHPIPGLKTDFHLPKLKYQAQLTISSSSNSWISLLDLSPYLFLHVLPMDL